MEPDSSSPPSICLTVPPIFPSLPSLPLVPASQFLIRCVSLWLPVTLLRAPVLQLFCLSRPLSLQLPLRALGLSGSCQESRRARWCHRRRHRWGRPGQPVCSAPPRGGTLRCESCHTAATAEPARKQTHTHTQALKSSHSCLCRGKEYVHTKLAKTEPGTCKGRACSAKAPVRSVRTARRHWNSFGDPFPHTSLRHWIRPFL